MEFKIVGTGYEPMPDGFDPSNGTVSRAVATCPVCGSTVEAKTTHKLFQQGKSGERMVAVVTHKPGTTGKKYRLATEQDMEIFREAEAYLKEKREKLMQEWGMDPVPDEPITRVPVSFGVINVWVYGMNKWGDLFNARQKLALVTFAEKVRALTPGPSPKLWERGENRREKLERPSREMIERARELRKRATSAEQLLWQLLRNRQLLGRKFRRQHPMGKFVADFFCDDARLVIEIDGAVHLEPSQRERDEIRQEIIEQHGYSVIRFTNDQVFEQTEQVLDEIARFVAMHSYENRPSPPYPLSQVFGREGFPGEDFRISTKESAEETHPSPAAAGEGPGVRANYPKAVASYLGMALDRQADYNSSLCLWAVAGEFIAHTFGRQALPMIWDYFELCPWSVATGDWNSALDWVFKSVVNFSCSSNNYSNISQIAANSMQFNDNFFDAVFTDPPYYDNVPYSYLSDFFYVWLKRSIGAAFPELFSTPLTPKKNEIVAYSNGPGGWENGKAFFEEMLKKSFREIHRVLIPNGTAVIVYAHKSTAGWETLINSLLDSGLIMTGAWPLNTEMGSRLRATESAALASSIYIVARKMQRESTGFYNQVKEELNKYLNQKLDRLWQEGISGADFFIAAIGSAIEVFGKYEKVMDYEGNIIRANRLLMDVRKIATDYAVRQILHNGFAGEISDLTRFYVLYRWEFGAAKAPFDEARKLAASCGIDLSQIWNKHKFIKKAKEFVKVLGPQERNPEELKNSGELIDVLQKALLLWEKSKREEMMQVLQESGYANSEAFYRVAQAISETLPNESKEKKLLEGFLSGRERIRAESRKTSMQGRLFD